MNVTIILMGILIVTSLISSVIALFDIHKKRLFKEYPSISFLIPTYNDCDSIEDTIKGILDSYDKSKSEIVVINDCSTDNTNEKLTELNAKYGITIICNEHNMGKSHSINNAVDLTHNEIVFIVDSDLILNKVAVTDLVARFQSNPKVGGVSCRYKVRNKINFLTKMQDVEYCMLSFLQGAYNPFGTVSMWGGCMAFRRQAFYDIGKLSANFIIEDMDAALKLKEHGWKAEQSFNGVLTYVPSTLKSWYKQKIRWSSGFGQCFWTHTRTYFSNPIAIMAAASYTLLTFCFIANIFFNHQLFLNLFNMYSAFLEVGVSWLTSTWEIFQIYIPYIAQMAIGILLYPLFSVLPLLYDKDYVTKLRMLAIYPFSFIYYPMLSVVGVIGYFIGTKKYFELRKGGRGW
jgi:poly-beta-1,6-N-acetyl-D-glucosamine synthase